MTRAGKAPIAQPQERRLRKSKVSGSTPDGGSVTQTDRERAAFDLFKKIRDNREEILAAFIAKYGIEDPAQIEQVTTEDPATGHTVWFVRRKASS